MKAAQKSVEAARNHVIWALIALGYNDGSEAVANPMQRLLAAAGDGDLPLGLARLRDVLNEAVRLLGRRDDPVTPALRGFETPSGAVDVLLTDGAVIYEKVTGRRAKFSVNSGRTGGAFVAFLHALASPFGEPPSANTLRERWRQLYSETNMVRSIRK